MVDVDDVRIELRKDDFTDAEVEFIQRKIDEYSDRAERINRNAPDHIKDEYIISGVIHAYMSDYGSDSVSFSDGRFSVSRANIRDNPITDRLRKALLYLQGIRVFHKKDDEG